MKFDFEKSFTKCEYLKFVDAVNERKEYAFNYGKYGDKMQVEICGRSCDNGVWLPENYLWSVGMTDCRSGYSGRSSPRRISELMSYDEIIEMVYDWFKLPRPTNYQPSFFEFITA
ncbi:MAG: hypothetical protein FWC11_01805 [Firmicutes bacterium]|nr:hypothetical protein [Bacillota bacterium]